MMRRTTREIIKRMHNDNPLLEECMPDIEMAFSILAQCYQSGKKVLICGNGGSASDSEHIVGELMKGFKSRRLLSAKDRKHIMDSFEEEGEYLADNLQGALPAVSLVSHTSLTSAIINDVAPDMVFAQQVYGLGDKGDVLIGLSTSGNSLNVVNALKIAMVFGLKTIGLTNRDGGEIKKLCDVCIRVPADETYRVQEFHLPVYHILCAMLESEFFI